MRYVILRMIAPYQQPFLDLIIKPVQQTEPLVVPVILELKSKSQFSLSEGCASLVHDAEQNK